MSGLGDEERDTAAEVFNHLVTPSGTKIAHTIPDLAGYSGREPAQVQALIDRLTRRRPSHPASGSRRARR